MTTAASALEQHLGQRYPTLLFERYLCRRIAGSTLWSQHSWPGGNARDIFGPDKRPSPSSQTLLDRVASYLRSNQTRFGIKLVLWRVPDHYDHVHADMWPTGHAVPPCAGGAERYRYSDGRIVYAQQGRVQPQGTFTGGEEMSFTAAEEVWLKRLAAYAEYLTGLGADMDRLDATAESLGHVLSVHRLVAQDAGVSGDNHEAIKNHLLGR